MVSADVSSYISAAPRLGTWIAAERCPAHPHRFIIRLVHADMNHWTSPGSSRRWTSRADSWPPSGERSSPVACGSCLFGPGASGPRCGEPRANEAGRRLVHRPARCQMSRCISRNCRPSTRQGSRSPTGAGHNAAATLPRHRGCRASASYLMDCDKASQRLQRATLQLRQDSPVC